MNAVTIAQKITNGISCIVIVVFSVAPNTTTTNHYKTFRVSSLSNVPAILRFIAAIRANYSNLALIAEMKCRLF